MSSRIITDCGAYIKKSVPPFDDLVGKKFPTLEEIDTNWEEAHEHIEELLADVSRLTRSAVVQQYNELIIYNETKDEVFAPIQFVTLDDRNLPVIGFPKFIPLDADDEFFRYSEEQCLVKLGYLSNTLNVPYTKVVEFLNKVNDICNYFALQRNDIIYNLSNIGFNDEYGLRVIDYGLLESDKNKFELIW